MLKRIKITNLLSFGDPGLDLELRPLNVLIGPNGSGKSNLLTVIQMLSALPSDLFQAMKGSGFITDWTWRGSTSTESLLSVETRSPLLDGTFHHDFEIDLQSFYQSFSREIIHHRDSNGAMTKVAHVEQGVVHTPIQKTGFLAERGARPEAWRYDVQKSALSQLADLGSHIWRLAWTYERMRCYMSWQFGPRTSIRAPQPTDGNGEILNDDFSNLALFLSRIEKSASAKRKLLDHFRLVFEGVENYSVNVEARYAQVFLHERPFDKAIPASRLSDGTLRYLSLLAILCDPEPALGTVCIDEPELGLHPDLLPGLAKLMIEASERMQLIVTTHSDIIIDALSETPESVVVCERHDGQTTMRRLVESELTEWLKDYRLGQLWTKGSIGGNRW